MNTKTRYEPEKKIKGRLWPSEAYYRQLKNLYNVINQPVYIIPIHQNQKNLTFSMTSKALTLNAVIDYPEPDPENHLFPHMLVFDNGMGLNLGRILQLSINRPFNPEQKDIIYKDSNMQKSIMFKERQLNKDFIRLRSRIGLAEILGTVDSIKLSLSDDRKALKDS